MWKVSRGSEIPPHGMETCNIRKLLGGARWSTEIRRILEKPKQAGEYTAEEENGAAKRNAAEDRHQEEHSSEEAGNLVSGGQGRCTVASLLQYPG